MLNLSKLVVYPDGNDPQIYHGCMNIQNERFKIKFSNPSNNKQNKDNIICEMDGKLSQILYDCQSMIKNTLIKCQTPEQFINELYNILYKTLDISSISTPIPSSFYSKICHELDIIGWQCIKQISSDMTQFILNTKPNKSTQSNKHELYFKINDINNFPNTKPIVIADQLPLAFEFKWTADNIILENNNDSDSEDETMESIENKQVSKYDHISNVIKQYNYECEKYETFWRILEDFYENCIVLEPKEINYGCNVLRILLDKAKRSTIEIKLNPEGLECQKYKCECIFYGINDEIIEYKTKWNEQSDDIWNDEMYPRQNIGEILDVRFIYEDDENEIDSIISEMECAMCLEFKNEENMMPDIVCKSCKQSFHKNCILEWFNSLDSVTRHYTLIEGKCPHCENLISFEVNE